MEMQGLGWSNSYLTGKGGERNHQRPRRCLDDQAHEVDNDYFKHLFSYEWELTTSPAGAKQWIPKKGAGAGTVPDAHDKSKKHAPMMLTTDLALRMDPAYEKISRRFYEHPDEFATAFAKAWFKLTHRDMGPSHALLGASWCRRSRRSGRTLFRRPRTNRSRRRTSTTLKKDPRVGIAVSAAGLHCLGVRVDLPRHR